MKYVNVFQGFATRSGCIGMALALLLLAGCGDSGPKLTKVQGKVLCDGQPLANALVTLLPTGSTDDDRRACTGTTSESGEYVLASSWGPGAVPGEYKVTVSQMTKADGSPLVAMGEGLDLTQMRMQPGSKERLPSKFSSAAETTLTAVIGESQDTPLELSVTSQ
ncbi:MAG: carboxypeptidase-like regulatory domain-containing protein [Pirellulales bacterium]